MEIYSLYFVSKMRVKTWTLDFFNWSKYTHNVIVEPVFHAIIQATACWDSIHEMKTNNNLTCMNNICQRYNNNNKKQQFRCFHWNFLCFRKIQLILKRYWYFICDLQRKNHNILISYSNSKSYNYSENLLHHMHISHIQQHR